MALPEGYYSEEDFSEDEGLSFPDDFPQSRRKIAELDESNLSPGQKLINSLLERKLEELKVLLEAGADVNYTSENCGWTPLMYAASLGLSNQVKLLLDQGANPNFHDKLTTPLMCLCNSSSFDEEELLLCFQFLLDAGASINVCDMNRMTPLMHAAGRGHMLLVERLIELGIDLEMCDNDGWTAIFFAVNSGDSSMVQLLKDSGSNIFLTDLKGRSLHELAIVKRFQVIAEIVADNQADREDVQHYFQNGKKLTNYQFVMSDMPDYNISDYNGFVEDTVKTIVAADLSNLIPLFLEKRIGYGEFLTYTEEEWKKAGIEMSFDRKRLTNYASRVILKKWSQEAFFKQLDEDFSLFKLAQNISNHIRIVHILIATNCICKRELLKTEFEQEKNAKIKHLLNIYLYEVKLLREVNEKLIHDVEEVDKRSPADFIGSDIH